jgi:hypothetical protein
MKEIWKDIPNYEGLYQISNLGRVKSLSRKWSPRETVLKAEGKSEEYLHVSLWKDRTSSHLYIHRCVAELFIPNPNNLPYVNHKDENKRNNTVDNLEWCSAQYNSNYGTRNERVGKSQVNGTTKSYPVIQTDLDGKFIAEYPSIMEAHRQTGISVNGIRVMCNGGYFDKRVNKFFPSRKIKGFIFKYK